MAGMLISAAGAHLRPETTSPVDGATIAFTGVPQTFTVNLQPFRRYKRFFPLLVMAQSIAAPRWRATSKMRSPFNLLTPFC
jgi:hypothetical protein